MPSAPSSVDIIPTVIMFSGGFVRCVLPFVRSSGHILLPRYLMNDLSNVDKTQRKYTPAITNRK